MESAVLVKLDLRIEMSPQNIVAAPDEKDLHIDIK